MSNGHAVSKYRTIKVRTQSKHFEGIMHTAISEEHGTATVEFAYFGNSFKVVMDAHDMYLGREEFHAELKGTIVELLKNEIIDEIYDAFQAALVKGTV